jgi:omega-6 fatty acid desaturase (delta-12 desaturase)
MTGVFVAAGAGVWLFYIQHQFEGVAWEHKEDWYFTQAALQGSSFYRLPKILQWFSGNIGFHHIHHLSPRIPNYNLEKLFQTVPSITLRSSLKSFNFRLWDEKSRRLVGFRHLKQMRRQPRTVAA